MRHPLDEIGGDAAGPVFRATVARVVVWQFGARATGSPDSFAAHLLDASEGRAGIDTGAHVAEHLSALCTCRQFLLQHRARARAKVIRTNQQHVCIIILRSCAPSVLCVRHPVMRKQTAGQQGETLFRTLSICSVCAFGCGGDEFAAEVLPTAASGESRRMR